MFTAGALLAPAAAAAGTAGAATAGAATAKAGLLATAGAKITAIGATPILGGLTTVAGAAKAISTVGTVMGAVGALKGPKAVAMPAAQAAVPTGDVATRTSPEVAAEEDRKRRAMLSMTGRASTIRAGALAQRPVLAPAGVLG